MRFGNRVQPSSFDNQASHRRNAAQWRDENGERVDQTTPERNSKLNNEYWKMQRAYCHKYWAICIFESCNSQFAFSQFAIPGYDRIVTVFPQLTHATEVG